MGYRRPWIDQWRLGLTKVSSLQQHVHAPVRVLQGRSIAKFDHVQTDKQLLTVLQGPSIARFDLVQTDRRLLSVGRPD